VCDVIAGSGLNHWVGFMRGGEYSDEEMAAIRRSGLMMGKIGVESGDQGQLDRMNKKQLTERVKRGIERLDASGIAILMTFVVGFPGETEETLGNTIGFLNDLSLTNLIAGYQVYPLIIFPLSELADPGIREAWKIEGIMGNWQHATMNSVQASRACYQVFREVTNVPYSYAEESFFFNQGMFNYDSRKKLYQLRQQLTLGLMENLPWEQLEPAVIRMAGLMELPATGIKDFRHELIIPAKP